MCTHSLAASQHVLSSGHLSVALLISNSSNAYLYRAMMETLLVYSQDAKKFQLMSEMFYKDDAGRMESTILVAS